MYQESSISFNDSLLTALNLFNNHEWYEAHDAFEEIWNSVDGDERQVIQGILQVSVSQFHLSKGNLNGATILLGEGLGRIKTRTKINLGIDLESFCQCLENLLRKLQYKELLNENDKPFFETSLMNLNMLLSLMKLLFSILIFFQENKKINRSPGK